MIKYIFGALNLFFAIRTVCYAVYTFKNRNITGGISVLALASGLAVMFVLSVIYILK